MFSQVVRGQTFLVAGLTLEQVVVLVVVGVIVHGVEVEPVFATRNVAEVFLDLVLRTHVIAELLETLLFLLTKVAVQKVQRL